MNKAERSYGDTDKMLLCIPRSGWDLGCWAVYMHSWRLGGTEGEGRISDTYRKKKSKTPYLKNSSLRSPWRRHEVQSVR